MNFDLRLMRRACLGICGTALLASMLFVGCVSGPKFHSTKFWDKGDVKASSIDDDAKADSAKTKKSKDAAAGTTAPKKGLAAKSKADDAPGRASLADFRDPLPEPAPTSTASIWSQIDAKGNDLSASESAKRAAAVRSRDVVRNSSAAGSTPVSRAPEVDPFADDDPSTRKAQTAPGQTAVVQSPTRKNDALKNDAAYDGAVKTAAAKTAGAPKSVARPTDDFAGLIDAQLADVQKKITRDDSAVAAKPASHNVRLAGASTDGLDSRTRSADTPPPSLEPHVQIREALAFNGSARASSSAGDGKGVANDLVTFGRTEDPATEQAVATADYTDAPAPAAPPEADSAFEKQAPSAADPFASEQATEHHSAGADVWQSAAESHKPLAAQVHKHEAADVEEAPKPLRRAMPSRSGRAAFPAAQFAATGSDSNGPLICDSSAVRGRFMGEDAAAAGGAHHAAKERIKPADHASVSWNDDAAFGEPAPIADTPSRRAQPQKKSDAHVTPASAQKTDSIWDEESPATRPAARAVPAKSAAPAPRLLAPAETPASPPAVKAAAAPSQPVESRMRAEGWFAIGMGLGLAASVGLWMRSRQKVGTAAS